MNRIVPGLAAIALAGPLMLAACNKAPSITAKDADVGEVAAKVADAGVRFQPGAWQTEVKTVAIELPGMPPEMADQMRGAMGRAHGERSCLTPLKAAQPDGDFFGQADKSCRYKTFSMAGGKIDSVLVCGGKGGSQTITLKGTYSSDHFAMDMDMTGKGPGGQDMHMHLASEARRVGECTPQEKAQAEADEKAAAI